MCVSLCLYMGSCVSVCVYVFLGVSVCVKPGASRGRSRTEPRRWAEGGARMRLSAQRLAGTAGARSGLKGPHTAGVRLLPVCWARERSLRPVRRLLGGGGVGANGVAARCEGSTVRGAAGDRPRSPAADSAPHAHWGPAEAGTPRPEDGTLWTLGSLASAGGREQTGETRVLLIQDRWGDWKRRPETPGTRVPRPRRRAHGSGRERTPPGLQIALHKVSAAQWGLLCPWGFSR